MACLSNRSTFQRWQSGGQRQRHGACVSCSGHLGHEFEDRAMERGSRNSGDHNAVIDLCDRLIGDLREIRDNGGDRRAE